MKKLAEAVADLEYKELFGLNAPLLPPCPDFLQTAGGATALMAAEPIFKFFGIASDETQTLMVSLARDLQAEWASHRSLLLQPASCGHTAPPRRRHGLLARRSQASAAPVQDCVHATASPERQRCTRALHVHHQERGQRQRT